MLAAARGSCARVKRNYHERNSNMSLRNHGLKALSLTFFAALVFMAISAAGASATTGKVLILNAAETVLSELHATFGAEVDLLLVLLIVPINLEIDCHKFTVQEGLYLTSGHDIDAKILFEECLVYQHTPLSILSECEIYPTAADRTAGTNKGKFLVEALLLVLKHTGAGGEKVIVIAEPKVAGGNFSKLFYKNCPAGASADIKGKLALLAHDGFGTHLVKHLFQEAAEPFRLGNQIKYGESNAVVAGSIWVFLIGEHLNRKWGLC